MQATYLLLYQDSGERRICDGDGSFELNVEKWQLRKHICSNDSDLISQLGDENKCLPGMPALHSTQGSDGTSHHRAAFFPPVYTDAAAVNLCIRHEQILPSVWFQERVFLAPG